eukprot:7226359-Prymnesium_polylepis.1
MGGGDGWRADGGWTRAGGREQVGWRVRAVVNGGRALSCAQHRPLFSAPPSRTPSLARRPP